MPNNDDDAERPLKPATRITRAGRDKSVTGPFVNPPVVHASTVLFETVDDMLHLRQRYVYGRRGTPTTEALEMAIAEISNADTAALFPSGLSAGANALLACVKAGDRILIVDCVYGPIRRFADTDLKRMGVETVYFDPHIGAGIEGLMTDRTSVVYLEAPGSVTFEMQDVPAIAEVAHRHGALVLFDNTWATPLYFRDLDHGVDLSIIAGTKYISGHSDVMLGSVAGRGDAIRKVKELHGNSGLHVGPDDVFLGLRGLRTMAVRLERHQQSAMVVARWLESRPEVSRVLYPALESHPGHALWKRDMTGACGLFAFIFDGWSEAKAKTFVEALTLFGIGASWGGFESLVTFSHPRFARTAVPWKAEGPLIRLHIGLEDPGDLIADLDAALAKAASTE